MSKRSKTIPHSLLAVSKYAIHRAGAASLSDNPHLLKNLAKDPVKYVVQKCAENENNFVSTLRELMNSNDSDIKDSATSSFYHKVGLINNALLRHGAGKRELKTLDKEKVLYFTSRT